MSIEQTGSVVQRATALREAGQEKEAVTLLEQHIEQEPNDMTAREYLGDIYYDQEAYQKARRQYRYIFDRRRHEVDVTLKLVRVYLCLPNRLRQAYNVLRRTTQHNPEHLTAWLRYANFCRVLIRDDEDVNALYAHIETLSTGDLEKELECASDHLFTGQLERAQAACARALVIAETDSRIYHLLYTIYLEQGIFWLADAALRQVMAVEQSSVQLYHDQAMLELKARNPEAAIRALTQALGCTDDSREQFALWRQLATLEMQTEAYADALLSLRQAVALEPSDVSTLYSLIVVHQQMTDYQAALQVLREQLLPVLGVADQQSRHLQGVLQPIITTDKHWLTNNWSASARQSAASSGRCAVIDGTRQRETSMINCMPNLRTNLRQKNPNSLSLIPWTWTSSCKPWPLSKA